MHHPENDFSPLLIDQQIEYPATLLPREEAHLIHDLQSMYEQDNRATIDRVWMRLSSQQAHQDTLPQREQGPERISSFKERGAHVVQKKQKPRQANAFVQRLSRLVALLAVALLVGSLALILTLHHAGPTVGTGHISPTVGTGQVSPTTDTGTPLTSPSGWGKIVHTQTASGSGFSGLTWSPDSKRIAAFTASTPTIPGNGGAPTYNHDVQIWDATTGQHLVTVPVQDFIITLAWSPNSQQIAIGTLQSIIIVDGQSGNILRTIPASSQSQSQPSAFVASGVVPLSSRILASGGAVLRGLAWSPDGSQIAASIGYSSVLVWNLQTGTQVSLPVESGYDVSGAIGWSSNGEYIAADIALATATDPLSQYGVAVWNVATQREVFRQNTGMLPNASPSPQQHINVTLAWQPGTLNLAQIGAVKVGNNYEAAIFILDGTTGKTLKQQVVSISGLPNHVFAWSPDGKYLAYASPANGGNGNIVQILDASTWKVVYTDKDGQNFINELAWSPDGHYIATNETVAQTSVVNVWAALA